MKLTTSFAELLLLLYDSELNYSDFIGRNRQLLEQFITDGVLDYRIIGKQQKRIFCADVDNLKRYVHNKFEIPSLAAFVNFNSLADFKRSDAVFATSDSKARGTKVLTGFLVNCYEAFNCQLNNQLFEIKPAPGAFTFVSSHKTFLIPQDITVVIVENHENFKEIHRQQYLFEGLRPIFVWRYQNSNAIVEWLNAIPNRYVHFGDFDPKGIHIFLSEFRSKIGGDRGSFLVPGDIEMLLIDYGNRDLYEDQKSVIPAIQEYNSSELSPLLSLILKYKKGLSQEILIR